MSKSDRFKALLAAGYFPEELPPPFTTVDFARFRSAIAKEWQLIPQYPKSVPEIYSIPRAGSARRYLSLVNPVAEFHVSKLVADNWISIRKHLRSCNYSVEPIEILSDSKRAIPRPDFTLVALRQAEISSLYDNVLISDVSRFYGTLYTHSITWALHGKAWSKANLNLPPYKVSLGDRLDVAVRKGNDNQTIGIPVGPDSSRIISEIVIVAVDRQLREKLDLGRDSTLRNVDDWQIGFDSSSGAEEALSVLAAACRDYQLEIHPEKSRFARSSAIVEPLWPTQIRQTVIRRKVSEQARDIEHYFVQTFHMASLNVSQNVLDYAVKRTMSIHILQENWHRYETYLLKAVRSNFSVLPAVVQILVSYNALGFNIGKKRIEKLIVDTIRKASPLANHGEVAWSLFLSKALRLTLSNENIKPVLQLESSVCALLTLDLQARGQISSPIDTSLWQQSMTSQGLLSNMWLLAYEADLKGWLASPSPNHVNTHKHFSILKKYGISFYDRNKNVTRINKRRPKAVSPALKSYLHLMSVAGSRLPFSGMSMGPF